MVSSTGIFVNRFSISQLAIMTSSLDEKLAISDAKEKQSLIVKPFVVNGARIGTSSFANLKLCVDVAPNIGRKGMFGL